MMSRKIVAPFLLSALLLGTSSGASVKFRLKPEISLSPQSGVVGTTFSIQGRGFTPKGKVILSMFQPDKAILFGPPGSLKYNALSIGADDQGRFTSTIESKGLKPGHYLCVALDEKTNAVSNRVFFTVIAPLELDSVFRPEIEKKLRAGFIQLQTVHGSLDGVHRHAAVVFAKMQSYRNDQEEDFSDLEDYQTVIYEQDGERIRSFSDHDGIAQGFFQEIDSEISFTDINGDGLRELLVEVKSGMVDSCSSIYTGIYQVQNHSFRRIALDCIRGIEDVNHDGIYELILSNYSGIATKRHKTHNESSKGANQSQFCWPHQAHFHPFPFCVSCASSWLSSYDFDGSVGVLPERSPHCVARCL
jgi:hypothetical protein